MLRRLVPILALLVLTCLPQAARAWTYGDTLTVIWRPLPNLPALVRPGDTLTVWANAPSPTTGWNARLRFGTLVFPMPAAGGGYQAGLGRFVLGFVVPGGTPEEVYDLILNSAGGSPDTARHAVKVLPAFKSDYYFAQISDTHLPEHPFSDGGGFSPTDTSGMTDFDAVIEDLNILHPEFIIHTGDLVNEGELEEYPIPSPPTPMFQMGRAQAMLYRLRDPVFLSSGNHDIGGWKPTPPPDGFSRKNWWRYFGWPFLGNPPAADPYHSQDYHFDYDSLHVIGLEAYINNGQYDSYNTGTYGAQSFTSEQMTWLAQDIAAAGASQKLLFYHYDFGGTLPNGSPGPQYTQINPATLHLDGAIWGHFHSVPEDMNLPRSARPFNLGIQSVIDGKRTFRIFRVHNGHVSPGPMHHSGTTTDSLAASWSGPNDGTRRTLTATVSNRFGEAWDHARLVFAMVDHDSSYAATGGNLVRSIRQGGMAMVYVDCVLPAGTGALPSTTVVSVFPLAPVGVEAPLPLALRLDLPAPSPFCVGGGPVELRFSVPTSRAAQAEVYDLGGRRVMSLLDGRVSPGEHVLKWDGRTALGAPAPAGLYLVRLSSEGSQRVQKVMLIR